MDDEGGTQSGEEHEVDVEVEVAPQSPPSVVPTPITWAQAAALPASAHAGGWGTTTGPNSTTTPPAAPAADDHEGSQSPPSPDYDTPHFLDGISQDDYFASAAPVESNPYLWPNDRETSIRYAESLNYRAFHFTIPADRTTQVFIALDQSEGEFAARSLGWGTGERNLQIVASSVIRLLAHCHLLTADGVARVARTYNQPEEARRRAVHQLVRGKLPKLERELKLWKDPRPEDERPTSQPGARAMAQFLRSRDKPVTFQKIAQELKRSAAGAGVGKYRRLRRGQ